MSARRERATSTTRERTAMTSVLVLADGTKPNARALAAQIDPWLVARGMRVEVDLEARDVDGREAVRPARPPRSGPRPDLVVVLGGDGAILGAVRAFSADPVPTIGVNFGRVGFLASVESQQWEEALDEVLGGRAVVEPRMRLSCELRTRVAGTVHAIALNDAVVTRGAFQGMLSIALRDGDDWVTNYRADGLVVATPSGSTAYSMAAGGPILAPSMRAFVVTPVSPQALSHRPIVIDGERTLTLFVMRATGLTTLVVDGQGFYPMHEGDEVRITRHAVAYPLLSVASFDPYRRLRERLGWRGSFEPDVFPASTSAPERQIDPGEGGSL